jgi:hypothetical protein
VLDKVPMDEALYPKKWVFEQIISQCKKHHARLMNPQRDVYFEEDEYTPTEGGDKGKVIKCYKIAIMIDGWNLMRPFPEFREGGDEKAPLVTDNDNIDKAAYKTFIEILDSDTEDDDVGKPEEKKEAEPEKEEEVVPTAWACDVCTLINGIGTTTCEICGQGRRPPVEQIIAALKAQRLEEANPGGAQDAKKEDDTNKKEAEKGKTHEN